MTDELAGASYARFIDKRFAELGAEQFEKVLEESCDLGASLELEELKYNLTNVGKKEIVSIRWRAGSALQGEQRVDRNLRGDEHYGSILKERKVKTKRKCGLVLFTL